MPFFGEDGFIINKDHSALLQNSLSTFFSLDGITTLYSYSPTWGSLYFSAYDFYSWIGNDILLRYKILNLIILGITLFLLFQWFRKDNNSLFGLFGLCFFTLSFPVWAVVVANSSAPAATMTIFTSIAFYFVFFHYRKTESSLKLFLFLLLILFFARFSILLKGEARLLFPIMFLYFFFESIYIFIHFKIPLVFSPVDKVHNMFSEAWYFVMRQEPPRSCHQSIVTERSGDWWFLTKERRSSNGNRAYFSFLKSLPLFQIKNIILLFVLFLLCIPVIPALNAIIDPSHQYTDMSHALYNNLFKNFPVFFSFCSDYPGECFIHTNYAFYYNLFLEMLVPLRPFGFFALTFIFLSFVIIFISHQFYRETSKVEMSKTEISKTETTPCSLSDSAQLCLFSGLWLILVSLAIISQRGFNYHSSFNWLLIDFYYAMFPFTLFFFTLMKLTYNAIINIHKASLKRVFFAFLFILLLLKFLFLLHWSGLYLDYYVGNKESSVYLFQEYPLANVIFFRQGIVAYGTQKAPDMPKFLKELNTLGFPQDCSFIGAGIFSVTPNSNISFSENDTFFLVSNAPVNNTCPTLQLSMTRMPQNKTFYYQIKNSFALSKETYIYTINTHFLHINNHIFHP